MSYYDDVYRKRLNRYGIDYQTRTQGQRERFFEDLLVKSIYRVDFEYNSALIPGVLEKYKQDETETLQYLLTRVTDNLPNGTIVWLNDNIKSTEKHPWMIYYLEKLKASGYNRYIVMKMTHYITWKARDGQNYSSWCYLYGQENNALKDDLKSRSRYDAIYNENQKLNFFVMPLNENINKDDYFELGEGKLKQGYRVTGFDFNSTPGVAYISVDPQYVRDLTPAPKPTPTSDPNDFFWFNGGES